MRQAGQSGVRRWFAGRETGKGAGQADGRWASAGRAREGGGPRWRGETSGPGFGFGLLGCLVGLGWVLVFLSLSISISISLPIQTNSIKSI